MTYLNPMIERSSLMGINESFNVDDITLYEVHFNVGDKTYILREASGGAVIKYRNKLLQGAKIGPDGKPTAIGVEMADAEPLLVSLCVFETIEDKDRLKVGDSDYLPHIRLDKSGKPINVTMDVVTSWPHRLQRRLFDKIKEVSELDDREKLERQKLSLESRIADLHKEDPAKNELDSIQVG